MHVSLLSSIPPGLARPWVACAGSQVEVLLQGLRGCTLQAWRVRWAARRRRQRAVEPRECPGLIQPEAAKSDRCTSSRTATNKVVADECDSRPGGRCSCFPRPWRGR